jgi:hypothetical protein
VTRWRAVVDAICAAPPGAEASAPWPARCLEGGGRMFAAQGVQPDLSITCADVGTALMPIEAGVGERAPYFRRSRVRLPEGGSRGGPAQGGGVLRHEADRVAGDGAGKVGGAAKGAGFCVRAGLATELNVATADSARC